MNCPNCGEALFDVRQKFCVKCGAELPPISKSLQISNFNEESIPISESKPTTSYADLPSAKPWIGEQKESSGFFSKMCLLLSILTLGIAILGLYFSLRMFFFPNTSWFFGSGNRVMLLIIFLQIGVVLAILTKVTSDKAEKSEDTNKAVKIGTKLGMIGAIIIMILLMILIFVRIILL